MARPLTVFVLFVNQTLKIHQPSPYPFCRPVVRFLLNTLDIYVYKNTRGGGGVNSPQNVSLDIGEFTYIDTFICVLSICIGRYLGMSMQRLIAVVYYGSVVKVTMTPRNHPGCRVVSETKFQC